MAVVIAMSGTAYAATGGSFILGRANHETSTASLADSKGTPLALSAPAHRAPLAVNRNTMVKNLNAQYLGGLTATGLAETGGEGFTAPNTRAPISSTATIVASTGPLHSGTYYVRPRMRDQRSEPTRAVSTARGTRQALPRKFQVSIFVDASPACQ